MSNGPSRSLSRCISATSRALFLGVESLPEEEEEEVEGLALVGVPGVATEREGARAEAGAFCFSAAPRMTSSTLSSSRTFAETTMLPSFVNFTALLSRLIRT